MASENIKISAIDPSKLLTYQIPHVTALLEGLLNHRRVLDASDTGTGKTYAACSVANNLELPVGVVCTKAAKGEWLKALSYFGITPVFIENYEMIRDRETEYTRFVKNGTKDRFELNVPKEFLLFMDESHRCKGMGTLNSRLMKRVKDSGCYAVAMSATPATNPLEMDALGYFLGLHSGSDFYPWAMKHGCGKGPFRGLVYFGKKDYMKQIHEKIFPAKGSRMRVSEIKDFPESSVQFTPVHFDKVPNYDELLKAREIDFMERGIQSGEHLAALTDYRRAMELLKVPYLVEMTEDLVAQGYSVPIFVNFRETAKQLSDQLNCEQINGDVSDIERRRIQQVFQDNEFYSLVLTAGAGGESISLHDLNGRPRISLICPMYSAFRFRQILGRIHRSGAKSKSIQKVIYGLNTLEAQVCFKTEEKLARLDLLTDGDLAEADPLTFKQWKQKYEHTTGHTLDTSTCESLTLET